jgi:hypothetical protein
MAIDVRMFHALVQYIKRRGVYEKTRCFGFCRLLCTTD